MTRSLSVISDFNAAPFAGYFANTARDGELTVSVAPFGQVYQELGQGHGKANFSFVWTRAEGIVASFNRALEMHSVREQDVLAEVDFFADTLIKHAGSVDHCFVSTWVMPPSQLGYGLLDWRPGLGLKNLLARMNLRLAERLADSTNVYLLDPAVWLQKSANPATAKMWYVAKIPYANECFEAAAAQVLSAIDAVNGQSRRLIIVDLDDTLWGGIVGDVGAEGLRLGGHDHIGEAFSGFQSALKALARRGTQLGIVSKNEESRALAAIETHPEMILRQSDFAGWRINWQDKAQNVAELVDELRLGLGSVVFLDDNPAERERVRSALPDVLVPDWPSDPCKYVHALQGLGVFDVSVISDEDLHRTEMYATDRERRINADMSESMGDYLQNLSTEAVVAPLDAASLPRITQLFNKTNQLNMSTRRLTKDEIEAWAGAPGRSLLSLSVSDRFGDLGLTGILSLEVRDKQAVLVDYVLSCRVMGRKIEEAMVHLAVQAARDVGATTMTARYIATDRNGPTLQALRDSKLAEPEEGVFNWDCAKSYPKPDTVSLVYPTQAP